MIFPITVFQEFTKHLNYSEQGSLRQTCKCIRDLPITNDDKLEYIDRLTEPTISDIVDYIFDQCDWWVKGYNELDNKTLSFVNDSESEITISIRKQNVYQVVKTREFSHYKHGRPRYVPHVSNYNMEKSELKVLLQNFKLSSGVLETKIYDRIKQVNKRKRQNNPGNPQ